jgi:predicted secreted protein
MTVAVASQGTLLQVGDGATPTEGFTTILGVKDIDGPGLTRSEIDVTSQDSPGYKEVIGGLKDGATLKFDVTFNPNEATHNETNGLIAKYLDGLTRHWRVVFPVSPARRWLVNGFLKDFSMKEPVDGAIVASVSIRVTGSVNFNA